MIHSVHGVAIRSIPFDHWRASGSAQAQQHGHDQRQGNCDMDSQQYDGQFATHLALRSPIFAQMVESDATTCKFFLRFAERNWFRAA